MQKFFMNLKKAEMSVYSIEWMCFRGIEFGVGVNDSISSANEQQKVY